MKLREPPCIHAVIVTYLSEPQALVDLIEALAPQVSGIQVVDNTPAENERLMALVDSFELGKVALLRLGDNFGIAKALNVGIECARHAGATHVLMSDQDSLPSPGMVRGLMDALHTQTANGCKVGAVGPTFTDHNTGITFAFQAEVPGKFFYGHARPGVQVPTVEALTLITSGTLVPMEVFDDVGPMREDFFIDQVDIEWCHRARARGWKLYGTCLATMFHRMGDRDLRVWYFGWRRETAYEPTRIYYRIRNFVALCKMPEVGLRWKVRNAWYSAGVVYSHALFGARRMACVAMALRGLGHGLRNRMGPYRA